MTIFYVTNFSNPWNGLYEGDCSWSTACGGASDDYAAQEFSISASSTLNSASWVEIDPDSGATSINWALYRANEENGLPGTLVSLGISSDTLKVIGTDTSDEAVQGTFSLPDVTLTSGNYFLALQSVSSEENYLAGGTLGRGAAETHDGGLTWSPGYSRYYYFSSLPITITAVSPAPEPSTWALMIAGIGVAGGAMRARARRSFAAVAGA